MRKPTQYNKKTSLKVELLQENMKALREKKGLRPTDVHQKIGKEGISLSQYCKYEKGESQMSLAFIIDWCGVMGVTLGELEAGKF